MEAYLHPAGLPRTRKRFVDAVQKIGMPPTRGSLGDLARVGVEFVVGGEKVEVEIERRELPYGGAQAFWLCPSCGARRYHLFVVPNAPAGSPLACRQCFPGGLTYRSQHVLNPALIRAAKLRCKLGAAPGLLSRLPPRPPHWRRDYWARSVRELAAAERVLVEMLGATLRAAKREKARRFDGR